MTKERLEELIKQEKVIYTSRFKKPDKFKLYKDYFVDKNKLWCLNKRIGICDCVIKLDKLFETREQAEWHLKKDAERTERFEPPMWEDIKDKYEFVFYNKEKLIYLDVFKTIKPNIGKSIQITSNDNDEIILQSDATKENYEKACEIVRELFLKGGEIK